MEAIIVLNVILEYTNRLGVNVETGELSRPNSSGLCPAFTTGRK
jgi:hypothetical protein